MKSIFHNSNTQYLLSMKQPPVYHEVLIVTIVFYTH